MFLPGYANRAHYHRWNYSAIVLSGGYKHYLYDIANEDSHKLKPSNLKQRMVYETNPGSCYSISNDFIHSVEAKPYTISLCLRGPSLTDKFFVWDKAIDNSWWQYGSSHETFEERRVKSISKGKLDEYIVKIKEVLRNVKQ
jgi:hypothetical protein